MRLPTLLQQFAIVALLLPGALYADPFTYDFDLTSTSGSFSGTGSLTVTSAIPGVGSIATFAGGYELTALTLSIDNDTFTLANDPQASLFTVDGAIDLLNYSALEGAELSFAAFQSQHTFTFQYTDARGVIQIDEGSFGDLIEVPAGVTPEPSSVVLLVTGLAGLAGMGRRGRARV